MKRQGASVRSSPTRDRYAGKRQQLGGEGRSARGGKRLGTGSRDASPAPPGRSPLPSTTASASSHPAQLQSQLQQHVAELAAKTPIHDLIPRVKNLGFPASCNFVLTLLERYVKACLTGDALMKINLPKKGALLSLITYFLLCEPVMVKVAGKKAKVEQRPQPCSPLEDLQLLMCLLGKLEEQQSIEQQYVMFDAIFGGCGAAIKTGVEAGDSFFERLVCLAVSLESTPVLSCVALWMQTHPNEALKLSSSLYSCFCEQLPSAKDPPMKLASLSPQLAQQLALSFTTLFPFHVVGTPVAGINLARLQPPVGLLRIISHWVEAAPDFLYAARLIEKKVDFPTFHSSSKSLRSMSPSSPLAGLMQWCILAPCEHTQQDSESRAKESKAASSIPGNTKDNGVAATGREEADFQSLVAQLHASLLSVILSSSQSFQHGSLTSDHIAVIVAALLGFSKHQPHQLKRRKVGKGVEMEVDGEEEGKKEEEGSSELEECVERLAQFLQISLSAGLLTLSADDLSSVASTLPKNRLLAVVISHHSRR